MSEPVVTCPFCRAAGAQLISLFGSQLLLSQYRCLSCRSYFEAVRDDESPAPRVEPSDKERVSPNLIRNEGGSQWPSN